jgi:phosphoglycolate phosphatase
VHPILNGADAVVFDLDGTLLDSFPDLQAAVNRARALRGLDPLDLEAVKAHVGRGVRNLAAHTIGPSEGPDLDAAVADFRAYYGAHRVDLTRPYPGVIAGLEALRGLSLAVLSNKPAALVHQILDDLGMARHFRAAFGGDSFPALKPDPRAMRGTLDALGTVPERAVMVGDTDVDVAAARAVGMRVVLVRTGLWRTVQAAPDAVVDRVSDLAGDGAS